MAAQAISDIFITAKFSKHAKTQVNKDQKELYLKKIVEECHPSFLKKCAVFLLIEDIIAGSHSLSSRKKRTTAAIVKTLLHSPSASKVMIHSKKPTEPKKYIEMILEAAEVKIMENSALKKSAAELKTRFLEAVDTISTQWESATSTSIIVEKFLVSWQEFTKLILEEKVNALEN